ncbi:MAG: Ubiquinol-cytochrome c reductase iron-sulfur subunit [Candidatus Accumulibacter regalis]|jgi:ubiquinol-cytochrome c reductase iron-sulfur subunit|uniref:Ubiquinol-cytochrome c reductase iron-sulfur subunit n=1 Tax=Accumulibacter regalis TaxID=522306 RepID=A0A011R7F5_ACCRE|nr:MULTISPECIES: ubiquinol-cytochrome c reductase iron-sulfur subunit [unclassified Candidatus Accumulibacter]EXI87069.1 MAG: Ubiquinol-cytochrome c reductase iron-sulfur subunit [Candidatus Accumulibacter regalis]MQM33099.1 ubiquinol-cytochrome c reductase iron-sulfur subunit [Candidatus Accumulibacter phosphatis]MBL8367137.1 ubiquinol-cytochrome c reductase iron-sulfur subunit [Accumulibacter sp.]MBN8514832.1 ubiquinol-cytochrome c reductase iron-sulfur subunit [Accumulibacter sp.]HRE70530.1
MSNESKVDCGRRRLVVATAAVGGAGALVALVPFLSSMLPSERAKAAGAPVEVDIGNLEVGQMMTVEWRGKPVWIINRSKTMLETLPELNKDMADPKSDKDMQPEYCKNETRSIKPEYMVVVGICTHLGCSPSAKFKHGPADGMAADWLGGFLCPCHGSHFDFAGRVFKSQPAPTNLEVPPHMYLTDTRILIGEHKKGA